MLRETIEAYGSIIAFVFRHFFLTRVPGIGMVFLSCMAGPVTPEKRTRPSNFDRLDEMNQIFDDLPRRLPPDNRVPGRCVDGIRWAVFVDCRCFKTRSQKTKEKRKTHLTLRGLKWFSLVSSHIFTGFHGSIHVYSVVIVDASLHLSYFVL